MILFGLVLGRWWKTCLALAFVVWPAILWFSGVTADASDLLRGSLLGALNAGVGVLVHQTVLFLFRLLNGRHERRRKRSLAGG